MFSSQAWVGTRMSRSESPRASLTTRTSKQYDSQWHIPSVGADWPGTVWCFTGGVPVTLLSWPNVSPSANFSCREVQSSVTWALSAPCFCASFPWSSFLGEFWEAMTAIWQLRWLSELRGSCESGMNYHGARVATVSALTQDN